MQLSNNRNTVKMKTREAGRLNSGDNSFEGNKQKFYRGELDRRVMRQNKARGRDEATIAKDDDYNPVINTYRKLRGN